MKQTPEQFEELIKLQDSLMAEAGWQKREADILISHNGDYFKVYKTAVGDKVATASIVITHTDPYGPSCIMYGSYESEGTNLLVVCTQRFCMSHVGNAQADMIEKIKDFCTEAEERINDSYAVRLLKGATA